MQGGGGGGKGVREKRSELSGKKGRVCFIGF